jgi:hypothetical protein
MREIIIFQLNFIQIVGENLDAHDCVIQKICERSFGILTFFLRVVQREISRKVRLSIFLRGFS